MVFLKRTDGATIYLTIVLCVHSVGIVHSPLVMTALGSVITATDSSLRVIKHGQG